MASTATGTVAVPRAYEGPARIDEDAVVSSRLFSYDTDGGLVTGNMEHASRTTDQSEEDTLAFWRTGAEEVCRFWRDIFIPNLQKLVDERS
jgi:hypothetical protein